MSDEQPTAYPAGSRVEVRDEEWLVQSATITDADGYKVTVEGVSELVAGDTAIFFDKIDDVKRLDPEATVLVHDESPNFRRSRLYLEAVLRRTPLPRAESRLALSSGFLLNAMNYQLRPAELALSGLRPRLLIADVVGLGKTIEIGILLAELIRRGRGERLLVVTPQHVLEQFQHEMWTRFSIPLVRLDSDGIERIQQEIPAGRNPFLYFKRVIISVDTLKSVGAYAHYLDNLDWDAVVIDESHNLIARSSQRNRLARTLAPRTDALILASATPHNGDKRSFAELVNLLDPAAIADPDEYTAEDIKNLYIRRTKINPEVRDQVGDNWPERGPSIPIHCAATRTEEEIFAELTTHWLHRTAGTPSERLFAYTLLKAFLSSHHALLDSVESRLKVSRDDGEIRRLHRLRDLAKDTTDEDSAKLKALVAYLTEIGIRPGGRTRVVVFSERIRTLHWLAGVVPPILGLSERSVRVMHGGLTDRDQQRVVEEFKLAGSDVRILFTGDVASEGVNLHSECHHLVHYDIPWSLIRIEQRNGRIDRFGQRHHPQFRALILTSATPDAQDDRTVAEKLLHKEEAAHRSLGTAEAITGLYDARKEEDRLTLDLLRGQTVEQAVPDSPAVDDILADILSDAATSTVRPDPPKMTPPSLFASTQRFVADALLDLYGPGGGELQLSTEEDLIALDAPPDLQRRLSDLPRSYLAAHRDNGTLRLKMTFNKQFAQDKLDQARERKTTIWPDVMYLSEVHPFIEWLTDKVLVRLDRRQAPVIRANIAGPAFLLQGVYCNRKGQPTVVEWMAVSGLPDQPVIRSIADVLVEAGVQPTMANPAQAFNLDDLQQLVPPAVRAAREYVTARRADWDTRIEAPLLAYRGQLTRWHHQATLFDDDTISPVRAARERRINDVVKTQTIMIDRLETTGEPLIRLLAVVTGGPQ